MVDGEVFGGQRYRAQESREPAPKSSLPLPDDMVYREGEATFIVQGTIVADRFTGMMGSRSTNGVV